MAAQKADEISRPAEPSAVASRAATADSRAARLAFSFIEDAQGTDPGDGSLSDIVTVNGMIAAPLQFFADRSCAGAGNTFNQIVSNAPAR